MFTKAARSGPHVSTSAAKTVSRWVAATPTAGLTLLLLAAPLATIGCQGAGCLDVPPRVWSCADIQAEQRRLDRLTEVDTDTCPTRIGTFAGDSRPLNEIAFCSDVCPTYTSVYLVYAEIKDPAECERLGGKVSRHPGWGVFIGCTPSCPQ